MNFEDFSSRCKHLKLKILRPKDNPPYEAKLCSCPKRECQNIDCSEETCPLYGNYGNAKDKAPRSFYWSSLMLLAMMDLNSLEDVEKFFTASGDKALDAEKENFVSLIRKYGSVKKAFRALTMEQISDIFLSDD